MQVYHFRGRRLYYEKIIPPLMFLIMFGLILFLVVTHVLPVNNGEPLFWNQSFENKVTLETVFLDADGFLKAKVIDGSGQLTDYRLQDWWAGRIRHSYRRGERLFIIKCDRSWKDPEWNCFFLQSTEGKFLGIF